MATSLQDWMRNVGGSRALLGRHRDQFLSQFSPQASLEGFQPFQAAPFQGISTEQMEQLGATAGNQIFEMQRRRLASQGQGSQRALAGMFAGRGGGASSAAASAITRQLAAERDALADASLQAQLAGRQLGSAEAERLTGQNQFQSQLEQQARLSGFQGRQDLLLQALSGRQSAAMQLQQQQFAREQERRARRSQLIGGIFGGIGSMVPGIGPVMGNMFGSGGAGVPYTPQFTSA